MATTKLAAITAKGRPRGTRFSTLVKARSARCVLTTTSFASSTSPPGWVAKRPSRRCLTSLTAAGSFERTGWPNNGTKDGAQQYFDWFKYHSGARVRFTGNGARNSRPSSITADAKGRELQS